MKPYLYLIPLPLSFGLAWVAALALDQVKSPPKRATHSVSHADIQPSPTPRQGIRLLIGGDAICHGPQELAARTTQGYQFAPSFAKIKPWLQDADLALINLETPLGHPYSGYPSFMSPPAFAQGMIDAGVDLFGFANNHILHRGASGYNSTLNTLNQLKIPAIGGFRNLAERQKKAHTLVEIQGIKIAYLAYTFAINGRTKIPAHLPMLDKKTMSKEIQIAKKEADWVMVLPHWGVEYRTRPEKSQRELTTWFFKQGVQAVLGSHPHVPQPMEWHRTKDQNQFVAYSLGNWISNQRKIPLQQGSAWVELDLARDSTGKVQIIDAAYRLHWTKKSDQVSPDQFQLRLARDTSGLTFSQQQERAQFVNQALQVMSNNRNVRERSEQN